MSFAALGKKRMISFAATTVGVPYGVQQAFKAKNDVTEEEMRRVFNLGIGFCLIIPQDSYVDTGIKIWGHGMRSWVIGEVSSK